MASLYCFTWVVGYSDVAPAGRCKQFHLCIPLLFRLNGTVCHRESSPGTVPTFVVVGVGLTGRLVSLALGVNEQ